MMKHWFYRHKEYGICLFWKALTDCNVSYRTIESASRRESRSFKIIEHPEEKKLKLIVWEYLLPKYKRIIIDNIKCDPQEYLLSQPLRDLVREEPKVEEWFMKELIRMGVGDVAKYVNKYTEAVKWLRLFIRLREDKQFLKESLNLNIKQATAQILKIIISDNISLPNHERSFLKKVQDFERDGCKCIINGRFGNKNTAKIGKTDMGYNRDLAEEQTAVIRKACTMHNNFNSKFISDKVNIVFKENGWPTISAGTVYDIIVANTHLTTAGKRGKRAFNNEIAMQVKRSRPEFPLEYFTLDGWTVELGYMDTDGKVKRLVAVIAIDTMNNYPIGYAIGDRENSELIKMACRNSLLHAKELFGDYYRPWQLQSDNFALKQNTSFYKAMAHLHTPAAVGNAKSKVIEPYFMYLNKKYCQTQYNWTGFNVDASKKNQVNREFSDKIKKQFPTKEGVTSQIEAMIMQDRALKKDVYLQQWSALADTEKVKLDRMDWLMVFGQTTGYTNSITGMGLMPTINGKQVVYDSFDPKFRAHQHLSWEVVYDEYDLSSILVVSEDGKHRFVLEQKRILPMNKRSMSVEDHAYLAKIYKFNKDREEEIKQTYIKDTAIVEKILSNTLELDNESEMALKGMFIYNGQQKESLQDAKGLKQAQAKEEKLLKESQQQEATENLAKQIEYWNSKLSEHNWD